MKRLFSFLLVVALMVTVFAIPTNATLVEYMYGDVTQDDSIDVIDATAIQLHLAGVNELVSINLAIADFDNDKEVSILDATKIQQYNAELIDNPRGRNDYLEYYVDIKDIAIDSDYGEKIYANKQIEFKVVFGEVYNVSGDGSVDYKYTITGITDPSYYETYSDDSYNKSPYFVRAFQNAGVYEITVEISKLYNVGKCSYTKRFEVLPAFEFDQNRFGDYSNMGIWGEYPSAPEDAEAVNYKIALNGSSMHIGDKYGYCYSSEQFVALIHSKEEYDWLFNVDNQKFTDEFFESKSLVVALSMGNEYYDLSPIEGLSKKDGTLYVKVVYGNDSPNGEMQLPVCPTWYSFAAVDKADVENITSVQRVS